MCLHDKIRRRQGTSPQPKNTHDRTHRRSWQSRCRRESQGTAGRTASHVIEAHFAALLFGAGIISADYAITSSVVHAILIIAPLPILIWPILLAVTCTVTSMLVFTQAAA